MNVLDLFCGCGGLSKGFELAGYNVLLGIDNDKAALYTFEKNHNNSIGMDADLSKQETFEKISEIIGNMKVDLIVGGPPCQGFSLSGPRNFDDPRNKLYLAMIEMVKKFKPKGFVIENVPGMARLYNGEVKNEIIRRFEEIGYTVNCKILCAADYGVPQMRKRLIFVGIKGEKRFDFPKPICNEKTYVTCEEAISDLPSREEELGEEIDEYIISPLSEYQKKMRKDAKKLYNHVATNHTKMVKDVIAHVPEGGNYKDLPEGVGTSRRFNEAWTRYHSQKPSRTIDTGHRNHFHYKFNRVPTVRENARLQSFSDDFIFYGTKTQQNRQVGNAVPPLLGFAIAEEIKKYIQ
ncbi:MAG: DNA cytosine methyltransferase [Eubacterium sp.]|nr:DNA cytosine methyltransferase [Eubacterium sp.]